MIAIVSTITLTSVILILIVRWAAKRGDADV
jgi:hypothetical protein